MSRPYPGAVVDHVPSEWRGQVLGFLLELAKLFTEAQPLCVHDDVEQGNRGASVVCSLCQ